MFKLNWHLLLLLALFIGVIALFEIGPPKGTVLAVPTKNSTAARDRIKAMEMTHIDIEDLVELDGKTRQEVYDLRGKYANKHPEFMGEGYKPSDAVFGQIVDGIPWWGVYGLSHYANGLNSIAGPSEESRFLANPLLLVGLDTGEAFELHGTPVEAIYPKPFDLRWRKDGKFARVSYDVTQYWTKLDKVDMKWRMGDGFSLMAYNARDLGYNYLLVSRADSENVRVFEKPAKILHFIHKGQSCGYPGGCNNMSPFQQEMEIRVVNLPAQLYIKLWKNEPANAEAEPDMVFFIDLI